MDISFELYKVFYITARAGSISNAAKELFISQPAVSQSIKQLEEKLGGQLFFRTPKGITLTVEGEVLFKYIEQAYNFIFAAETKFTEMQNLCSGEVRIGASDTICKYYLLPYLESFNRSYPHIRLQVTNRTTQETIKLLKGGRVDFGIINLPIDEDSQLVVHESMEIQDCFVVGEKYKEYSGRQLELQELLELPILLLEKGSSIRRFVDNYAKTNGIDRVPEIELGSIDLLVEFARIGLGAACVIKEFINKELEASVLYEIQLKQKLPSRKIGIVSLRDVPLSAAAQKFIGYLP